MNVRNAQHYALYARVLGIFIFRRLANGYAKQYTDAVGDDRGE